MNDSVWLSGVGYLEYNKISQVETRDISKVNRDADVV
jgi:hypothetical protein